MNTPDQIKEAEEYVSHHWPETGLKEAYLAALTGPSVSELVQALERYRHVHHMTATHSYGVLNCPDDCTFGGCEALKKFRGTP
jgi:hypothetical protein